MFFFFQAEDGIRDVAVTGVQTCALPISQDSEDNFFSSSGQPPMSFSSHSSDVRQHAYLQHSSHLWKNRFQLEGGLRWARLDTLRVQPVTGQLSLSRSEEHTSELQSRLHLVCRLL